MQENHLIILGSARKDSNTFKGVSYFYPDQTTYKLIDLLDYQINHYNYHEALNIDDDFKLLLKNLEWAQLITFATPVYWYSMSGPMKVFFDRLTDLLTTYKPIGRSLEGKRVNVIAVGNAKELPDGFSVPFQNTSNYFKMSFEGLRYYQI